VFRNVVIAAALLVFALGCGDRSGLDVDSMEGASVGAVPTLDDAGPGMSSGARSACSAFTTMVSCGAGGCGICAMSDGTWICYAPGDGVVFEDDAGREQGACGNLAGDIVTGPRRRW
jgi:hypothetical protein